MCRGWPIAIEACNAATSVEEGGWGGECNQHSWLVMSPEILAGGTIRLTETISVHFFGISETGKDNGPSKNTETSKS